MLDKELVVKKMKERGFTVYANIGNTKVQFVSEHMYDTSYVINTPKRKQTPIINVLVDLDKDEFECQYNVSGSLNVLKTPSCGPVLNDTHFDNIVCKFESHAKWLSKITE